MSYKYVKFAEKTKPLCSETKKFEGTTVAKEFRKYHIFEI